MGMILTDTTQTKGRNLVLGLRSIMIVAT